jgi:hypothetical protein
MADTKTFTEEIQTSAEKLLDTIQDLFHEGNVQHIVVKNPEGHTIMEVPVTVGVVGMLLAPVLAAVGAIAAYAANFTIVVTRTGEAPVPPVQPQVPPAS